MNVATQRARPDGRLVDFRLTSAIIAEFVGTLFFTIVIVAVTPQKGSTPMAGLIIGLTLVLIHFAFIPVSGASVNRRVRPGPGDLRRRHGAGARLDVSRGADVAGAVGG